MNPHIATPRYFQPIEPDCSNSEQVCKAGIRARES